jgi:hypothetical protein
MEYTRLQRTSNGNVTKYERNNAAKTILNIFFYHENRFWKICIVGGPKRILILTKMYRSTDLNLHDIKGNVRTGHAACMKRVKCMQNFILKV